MPKWMVSVSTKTHMIEVNEENEESKWGTGNLLKLILQMIFDPISESRSSLCLNKSEMWWLGLWAFWNFPVKWSHMPISFTDINGNTASSTLNHLFSTDKKTFMEQIELRKRQIAFKHKKSFKVISLWFGKNYGLMEGNIKMAVDFVTPRKLETTSIV